MNIWTILLSVLVFGLLVLFHELGHFLVARLFHIKVYEFSIGMGPKLIWYDSAKTGIRYKLCMIPFGGYVSFGDGQDDSAPSDDPAAFSNQKPWKRLLVLIAGGTVNLLLGFGLMFAVTAGTDLASTVVADFPGELLAEGNVSTEEYGLRSGDVIVSVGKRNVHTAMELDYEIMRQGVEPVSVTVRRGEEIKTFTVAFPTEVTSGQVVGTRDFRVYAFSEKTFGQLFTHSFYRSVCTVRMVWESLFDLILGRYSVEAVSGPVGVTATFSEAASYGVMPLLYLVALISINLGVVNLLPIPALDGGRTVFVLLEIIRKKPIPFEIESKFHSIALLLLLLLSFAITVKDIRSLF